MSKVVGIDKVNSLTASHSLPSCVVILKTQYKNWLETQTNNERCRVAFVTGPEVYVLL